MARKQRFPNITAAEAHAALRWLAVTGNVTAAEIRSALRKREALAAEIRAKLVALGGEGLRFLRGPEELKRRAPGRASGQEACVGGAAWQAQRWYLAAVQPLSKAERAKVRAIRERFGIRATTAVAKR